MCLEDQKLNSMKLGSLKYLIHTKIEKPIDRIVGEDCVPVQIWAWIPMKWGEHPSYLLVSSRVRCICRHLAWDSYIRSLSTPLSAKLIVIHAGTHWWLEYVKYDAKLTHPSPSSVHYSNSIPEHLIWPSIYVDSFFFSLPNLCICTL